MTSLIHASWIQHAGVRGRRAPGQGHGSGCHGNGARLGADTGVWDGATHLMFAATRDRP